MDQVTVLLLVIAAAAAFGLWRRWDDGRTKRVKSDTALGVAEIGAELGESATLLQFSSAFCAPCRQAKAVLSRTAENVPGVVHVELDAESHLELVRQLGVMRTPTTLLLDSNGEVRNRVAGVPKQDLLLAALADLKSE